VTDECTPTIEQVYACSLFTAGCMYSLFSCALSTCVVKYSSYEPRLRTRPLLHLAGRREEPFTFSRCVPVVRFHRALELEKDGPSDSSPTLLVGLSTVGGLSSRAWVGSWVAGWHPQRKIGKEKKYIDTQVPKRPLPQFASIRLVNCIHVCTYARGLAGVACPRLVLRVGRGW
jgi:hypothetical protein